MSGEGMKKFEVTNFTMPNNSCSMKYALKSVPEPADVGLFHGVGDGPRAKTYWLDGQEKLSND